MNLFAKIMKSTIGLWLISLVILFVFFFKPLYYFDIRYLNIPQESGYSEHIIKKNYNYILDYNLNFKDSNFDLPDIKSSTNGKIHFADVRNLVQLLIKIAILFTVTSIIGIFYCIKHKYYKIFLEAALQLIFLPAILALPFAVDFTSSFVIFHKILFRNDHWSFDASLDPVINILPEAFFFHSGALIIFLLFILSSLFFVFYAKIKRTNFTKSIK